MKKIILMVLGLIALLGIFSEPIEDSNWLFVFVISKAIGFSAIIALLLLLKRWKMAE